MTSNTESLGSKDLSYIEGEDAEGAASSAPTRTRHDYAVAVRHGEPDKNRSGNEKRRERGEPLAAFSNLRGPPA